ncbi:MAG: GH18 / CBM16, partial [uncultured Corynebacteriales bacterium]
EVCQGSARGRRGGGGRRGRPARHRLGRGRGAGEQPRFRERHGRLDVHRGDRHRHPGPVRRPRAGRHADVDHRRVRADGPGPGRRRLHADGLGPRRVRLPRRVRDRRRRREHLDARHRVGVRAADRPVHRRVRAGADPGPRLVRPGHLPRRRRLAVRAGRRPGPHGPPDGVPDTAAHHGAPHDAAPHDAPAHDHAARERDAAGAHAHRLLAQLRQRLGGAATARRAPHVRRRRGVLRRGDRHAGGRAVRGRPGAGQRARRLHRRGPGRRRGRAARPGRHGDPVGRRRAGPGGGDRRGQRVGVRDVGAGGDGPVRLRRRRHRPGERPERHLHGPGAAAAAERGRRPAHHHDGPADDRHAVPRRLVLRAGTVHQGHPHHRPHAVLQLRHHARLRRPGVRAGHRRLPHRPGLHPAGERPAPGPGLARPAGVAPGGRRRVRRPVGGQPGADLPGPGHRLRQLPAAAHLPGPARGDDLVGQLGPGPGVRLRGRGRRPARPAAL